MLSGTDGLSYRLDRGYDKGSLLGLLSKVMLTFMTLNYGNYGLFLIMGN